MARKRTGYFYEEQEQAFVDFLLAETKEQKNEIFREKLLYPFTKMTESIIRRYKLFIPEEEYQDTFDDAMSYLMTKADRFKIGSQFKAYSFCGTVIKNYLLYRINYKNRETRRYVPYEDIRGDIDDDLRYSFEAEDDGKTEMLKELFSGIIKEIERIMNHKEEYDLSEKEIIIGKLLVDLLQHWDEYFITNGSINFNKSSILLFLKENSNMTTNQVRHYMRKYKDAYYIIKNDILK